MRRGFTLIETLIAIFILVAAFCIFAALQNYTLVSSARMERRATAARLGRNRLAEVRAWASDPTHFAGDWGPLASPEPVAGQEQYQTSVEVLTAAVYSPSSSLGGADVTPAVKRVRVRTTAGADHVDLYSQIGAPRVDPGTMTITVAGDNPVAAGGTVDLTASLGVSGVVFLWEVVVVSGGGTLTVLAGDRVRFTNTETGAVQTECKVAAHAYYAGKEYAGESEVLKLDPP